MECKCGIANKLQTTYKLTYCKWQYGTLICPQCSCLNKSYVKPDHIVGTPKKIFEYIMYWSGPRSNPNSDKNYSIKIEVVYDIHYTIILTNIIMSSRDGRIEYNHYIKDIPEVPDVVLSSILFMSMRDDYITASEIKSQIITMLESAKVYKREIESKMQKELETANVRIKELESEKEKDDQCIQELQSKLDISCDIQKDILLYTEELQGSILELQTKLSTSKTEDFNYILEDALSEL